MHVSGQFIFKLIPHPQDTLLGYFSVVTEFQTCFCEPPGMVKWAKISTFHTKKVLKHSNLSEVMMSLN